MAEIPVGRRSLSGPYSSPNQPLGPAFGARAHFSLAHGPIEPVGCLTPLLVQHVRVQIRREALSCVPSSSCAADSDPPAAINMVAAVCRNSWTRSCGSPARSVALSSVLRIVVAPRGPPLPAVDPDRLDANDLEALRSRPNMLDRIALDLTPEPMSLFREEGD